MDRLRMVSRGLLRRKFRTCLTLFSIAIGVTSILTVGMVTQAGRETMERELDSLGVNGVAVSAVQAGVTLDSRDLALVRSLSCVESAMPVVAATGSVQFAAHRSEAVFWGIDGGADQVISLQIRYGRPFHAADVAQKADVCLLDSATAMLLFQRENVVGSRVTAQINGTSRNYTVVGVADTGSSLLQGVVGDYLPAMLYLPYPTLQQELGSEALQQIAVRVDGSMDTQAAGEQVRAALNGQKAVENAVKCDDLAKGREKLNRLLQIVTLVLSAVGGVSLLVAGMGTMTIMLASVSERTGEIGIKKSVGAGKWDIAREFLEESLLLTLIGSLLGLLFSRLLAAAAGSCFGVALQIGGAQLAAALLVSLLFGVGFGVYPAVSAAKLNPVDALRKEC